MHIEHMIGVRFGEPGRQPHPPAGLLLANNTMCLFNFLLTVLAVKSDDLRPSFSIAPGFPGSRPH